MSDNIVRLTPRSVGEMPDTAQNADTRAFALEALLGLTNCFAAYRVSLENMAKNELLLFRQELRAIGARHPTTNFDGHMGVRTLAEIIGHVIADRQDCRDVPLPRKPETAA